MSSVGIIANPASGKDIRRLVAYGSNFDNDEKVAIVRRVLLGLDAIAVERVWIMPDSFGIASRALDGLALTLEASILPMRPLYSQEDSQRAAALMAARDVGCLVTLGGDGTNRAVAKASGTVPLMPISTGTNNVFPMMIEGTIAGLAAGLVARGLAQSAVWQAPQLEVFTPANDGGENGPPCDIALVDAAVYDERFIGARAVWDVNKIKEVILTRLDHGNIGLSSLGAHLPIDPQPGQGLYLRTGRDQQHVLGAIAPGVLRSVALAEWRVLSPGDEVILRYAQPCVLALDGERELGVRPGIPLRIRLSNSGPRVVDPHKAIRSAARAGIFLTSG